MPQFLRSNEFINADDSVPRKDIKKYVFIVDKKTGRIKKYSLKTWDSSILSDINKKSFLRLNISSINIINNIIIEFLNFAFLNN